MNSKPINLSVIVFDAGTQIRASINEDVVSGYAERMTEGDQFPPVVLFYDSTTYYLADGFHRCMAAQRIKLLEIDADVRQGTKTDALWFALGANKANGARLTVADKKNAILLALKAWPDRSVRSMAEQIGCALSYFQRVKEQVTPSGHLGNAVVTGKDGKSYPASRPSKSSQPVAQRRPATKRVQEIAALAGRGHTSSQIARSLGVGEQQVRNVAAANNVVIHADRIVGKSYRHNATRILERIATDLENMAADEALIDVSQVDPAKRPMLVASIRTSLAVISRLARRLQKHAA